MAWDDDEDLARDAYLWAWPMVNTAKRADRARLFTHGGADAVHVQGAPVGYGQIVMLTGLVGPTQRIICCPSRNVVYGSGAFHLAGTAGVVVQVPDFGDRHWVYAFYDARTDEFSRLGKQYQTRPGFHLLVGPDWAGPTPAGIDYVWRCGTDLAFAIPRIYTDGTAQDLAAVQQQVKRVCSYPLADFIPGTWVERDWTDFRDEDPIVLHGRGDEARYVKAELFLPELRDVLDSVSPRPGEEDRYDRLGDLLRRAALNPVLRLRLKLAFKRAEAEIIAPLFQWGENGEAAGNGWYTERHAGAWDVGEYRARTATAKSNMFENRAEETKYFYTDTDSSGDLLFGSSRYAVTFQRDQLLKDHARAFWSITVYDEFHFFNTTTNPIGRYSIGTKDEGSLEYGADGSLTLYAGAAPPAEGPQNWLPVPDGEPFSLYIRAYWPDDAILNGVWQPPAIIKTG